MSGLMLDEAEEVCRELKRLIKEGTKEDFRTYTEKLASYGETEQARERILESGQYFLNNWTAARIRLMNRKTVKGCSAEGHVSHVLSDRMSSRLMGCHLRAYYLNGGNMLDLVRYQEQEPAKAAGAEEISCLSSTQILSSERNHHGQLGKYAEVERASLSLQTKEKLYFRQHILV